MVFGIYNILTTIWFIIILSSGSFLFYTTWDSILNSDLIFIAKLFIALIYILTSGVLIFFLLKLRFLIITKQRVLSIYPFRFRKTTILLDETKSSKFITWDIRTQKYITLEIKDNDNNKISLSDFEFENFDKILKSILGINYLKNSITHFKQQATQNYSLIYFITITSTLSLIFQVIYIKYSNLEYISKNINYTILIVTLFIILASIKRIIKYKSVLKKS